MVDTVIDIPFENLFTEYILVVFFKADSLMVWMPSLPARTVSPHLNERPFTIM